MKKHFAFLCTIILLVGVVGVANADIIAWEGVFTASNFEVECQMIPFLVLLVSLSTIVC